MATITGDASVFSHHRLSELDYKCDSARKLCDRHVFHIFLRQYKLRQIPNLIPLRVPPDQFVILPSIHHGSCQQPGAKYALLHT